MAKANFLFEWEAHEYEHKERSSDWFWAAGIVTVALAVVSILFGNVIFAIFIIVSAGSLALFLNRPPETIRVAVDDEGVTRNLIRYPFESLKAFWIDLDHPHQKIILRSQRLFMPLIVVPLSPSVDIESLRAHLKAHLAEEPLALPIVEQILEFLGF